MLNTHYEHQLLRKYQSVFGTLFNSIYVGRSDGTDAKAQFIKVPIEFGPREKYLAMVKAKPGEKAVAIQLPRMSFEITGMEYDPQRKLGRTQIIKDSSNNVLFEPAPWTINWQLNIITKSTFDASKIVEQILPYFSPDFTVSVALIDGLERTWDIPIVLTGVSHSDVYEGDFIQRRALIWTLDFTMKAYLHGPISQKKVIKFIKVNTYGAMDATGVMDRITIQPGLTANGQPTTDINETIPYTDIEKEDDWDYIIQVATLPIDE